MKQDRAFNSSFQYDAPSEWPAFLAPNATILQPGGKEYQGPDAVRHMFIDAVDSAMVRTLRWEPERAEVSRSGDLGYTIGGYLATGIDHAGKEVTQRGFYVTVWRKREDGRWMVEATARGR